MPVSVVDLAYLTSKKIDIQESIFGFVATKDNVCFNDIDAVRLPSKMCPFGCKKSKSGCPYDFDSSKCPHDLDKKSIDELAEYLTKLQYYDDDDVGVDYGKTIDPKIIEAWKKSKRPGNVS